MDIYTSAPWTLFLRFWLSCKLAQILATRFNRLNSNRFLVILFLVLFVRFHCEFCKTKNTRSNQFKFSSKKKSIQILKYQIVKNNLFSSYLPLTTRRNQNAQDHNSSIGSFNFSRKMKHVAHEEREELRVHYNNRMPNTWFFTSKVAEYILFATQGV